MLWEYDELTSRYPVGEGLSTIHTLRKPKQCGGRAEGWQSMSTAPEQARKNHHVNHADHWDVIVDDVPIPAHWVGDELIRGREKSCVHPIKARDDIDDPGNADRAAPFVA